MKSICVFTGSKIGSKPVYMESAISLGKAIAFRGLRLITGGSKYGLMSVLANAVIEEKGSVLTVIPLGEYDEAFYCGVAHEIVLVDSITERKKLMLSFSDAFILFPGGIGSIDEFINVLYLRNMGEHLKPIGIVNVGGYFDLFIEFVGKMIELGFMKPRDFEKIYIDNVIDNVLNNVLPD